MGTKVRKLILGILLLAALAPASVHAGACTLEAPPITVSDGAINGTWRGNLTFNITCPAGQSWTLYENLSSVYNYWTWALADGKAANLYVCRLSAAIGADCQSYRVGNNVIAASGVGTGAVQTVTTQVNGKVSEQAVYTDDVAVAGNFGVANARSPVNTMFRLNSDSVDYYASTYVATMISEQECLVTYKTNMALTYNGTATATGSFRVDHICGWGPIAPPVTITVGPGNNPLGGVRRATFNGGYLGYRLYWDTTRLNEIGATTNNSVSRDLTTGSQISSTIYGSVLRDDPGNHTPRGNGGYVDVVTISFTY